MVSTENNMGTVYFERSSTDVSVVLYSVLTGHPSLVACRFIAELHPSIDGDRSSSRMEPTDTQGRCSHTTFGSFAITCECIGA
jgi:hypothetical protein